jgi:adenylosuccinate lyase
MHPRYTLPAMQELWSEESKFNHWLIVELAFMQARVMHRNLSKEAFQAIQEHAKINVARIHELDAIYRHDLIAFVVDVQKSLKEAGVGQYTNEVHRHLTSYDTEDPAVVLMLQKAIVLNVAALRKLEEALFKKAHDHKWTLMIGRTHGQFAEPTTFGHLLLVFAEAIKRSRKRLRACIDTELNEGKIAGAIGNYCGIDPKISSDALSLLRLTPAKAETQILQRDRFATVLAAISIAGATIEQIARSLWELMRSDVGELQEMRAAKQRGSSHMAYKKNPITMEQLQGLPRLLRGYASTACENVSTPDFRAIEQSSVERHILPDSTALLHYMANKLAKHIDGLVVNAAHMIENLHRMQGIWASQQIRGALMDAGVSYDDAYLYLQKAGFEAWNSQKHLSEVIAILPISEDDPRTAAYLIEKKKLNSYFDVLTYIKPGIEHLFRDIAE